MVAKIAKIFLGLSLVLLAVWGHFQHGAHHSGSTLLHREPSEADPRLHAPLQSKPLRFGAQVALRGADSVGPAFCALPRSEQLR